MRTVTPARAALAGILGFGYVYVGRVRVALVLLGVGLAATALAAWTRLIFIPVVLYSVIAVLFAVAAATIVHPIVIAAGTSSPPQKRYNRWWFYCLWLAGIVLITDQLVRHRGDLLGYETFRIPSVSMTPTLQRGDFILVDAWAYTEALPQVGDVVVYEHESGLDYVKRIVGTPGDLVEIRADALIVNGAPVPEPYLAPDTSVPFRWRNAAALLLADGEYYVLGDNRPNSQDSRIHGPVNIERIVGRVRLIWFSTAGWQRFPARLERTDALPE